MTHLPSKLLGCLSEATCKKVVGSTDNLPYNGKPSINILNVVVNVDGRFLFEEAVSCQNGKDVHGKVEHAAMSRVHKLGYVFKLVVDGLNDRPFAQQYLVI